MSSRLRPTPLTIRPPSPNSIPPSITTPTHPISNATFSPRRAPLPPSPTHSTHSGVSGLSGLSSVSAAQDGSRGSSDLSRYGGGGPGDMPPPPLPAKTDKRLPLPPGLAGMIPSSPHRARGDRGYAGPGLYDNKLVSSTLSQLPPIPPLSPNPTGTTHTSSTTSANGTHHHPSMTSKPSFASLTSHALSSHSHSSHHHSHPAHTHSAPLSHASPRPSLSTPGVGSSVVVLPDGTTLSAQEGGERAEQVGGGRSMAETMAHSSPSSPWSLLTIHVLPLFAGSPLKTPIEDLNQLCHSHLMATSQRTPASRLVAVLGSDLRDFIASGMLTLKARIETVDEGKIIPRASEVWWFFWAQVLPYLEGVFLPFSQVRDLANTSTGQATSQSINVRHLLLSGYLLHILLPLLPRLIPIVTMNQSVAASLNAEAARSAAPPTTPDLQRILQMSLVLSTQARYSSFVPSKSAVENETRDTEVRDNVEGLGKAVRWRLAMITQRLADRLAGPAGSGPGVSGSPTNKNSQWPSKPASLQRAPSMLQRGPSMSQPARYRRRGWRASTNFGQLDPGPSGPSVPAHPGRQNSDFLQQPQSRWGRPRVDEEDEDDNLTPGQGFVPPSRQDSYATTMTGSTATTTGLTTAASTLTAGTIRDGLSPGFGGESQRTPLAEFGTRNGRVRADSSGSSEVTPMPPMPPDPRRMGRV